LGREYWDVGAGCDAFPHTAQELGFNIRKSILLRADEVIE
jgi:hypothetical protein